MNYKHIKLRFHAEQFPSIKHFYNTYALINMQSYFKVCSASSSAPRTADVKKLLTVCALTYSSALLWETCRHLRAFIEALLISEISFLSGNGALIC